MAALIILLFFLTPEVAGGATDITNNLFSDIGPLLALFGENFAKQFLRESFTWLDHIIFAMAPLGIITAIVGAIRVGGFPWLKAVIGRARENRASAELELMSSTSHEVCELCNGDGIVRTTGKGIVKQIIFLEGCENPEKECCLYTLTAAKKRNYMKKEIYRGPLVKQLVVWKKYYDESHDRLDRAPNISLNLHSKQNRWELGLVAFFGILLQSGVLVFSGFVSYDSQFANGVGGRPSAYAFPVLATGTCVLVLGMWICALVIGQSTEEYVWDVAPRCKGDLESTLGGEKSISKSLDSEDSDEEVSKRQLVGAPVKTKFRVFWLQKGFVVSDQSFDSFMLMGKGEKEIILTSCRNNDPVSAQDYQYLDKTIKSAYTFDSLWLNTLCLIGTVTGISGFVLQFEGFRGLSWACSIAQLVAILIMTILRALVRRGMLDSPVTGMVTQEYEMDWLALRIGFVESYLTNLSDPERPTCSKCGRRKRYKGVQGDCPPCIRLFWRVCNQVSYPARQEARPEWVQRQKRPTSGSSEEGALGEEAVSRQRTVMNVRKRLGKLTGWTAPPSPYAVSIARAIGQVMNIFPHWPKNTFVWYVDVQTTSERPKLLERLKLVAKRKGEGEKVSWTTSTNDIEALLSLWMYHFHDQDQSSNGSRVGQPASVWTPPMRTPFHRVLGPANNNLKRDLAWWAGRGVAEALDSFNWADDTEKSLSLGYGGQVSCLAMIVNMKMDQFLAQHIFSSFMWAIASDIRVPWMDSATTVEAQGKNKFNAQVADWDSLRLTNPTIQQIAKGVEVSGLGTLEDAYALIIPPLSVTNRLPNEVLVDEVRKKSKENEGNDELGRACDAHVELLRFAEGLISNERFVYKAVATAVDFLMTALSAPLTEDQTPDISGENLEMKKSGLVKALKSKSLQSICYNLREIYKDQKRDKEYDKALSWEEEGRVPKKKGNKSQKGGARSEQNLAEIFGRSELHRRIIKEGTEIDDHELSDFIGDLETSDILGWTPLHYAVIHAPKLALAMLKNTDMAEKFDLADKFDIAGRTPLQYAVINKELAPDIVLGLLNASPRTEKGRDGLLPLHWAARVGNLNAAKLLLKRHSHKDNIDARDYWRMTPLHFAAFEGHDDIVKLLLEVNRNIVDSQDWLDRSPLHLAVLNMQDKVVGELLKSRASTKLKNRVGKTALQIATEIGRSIDEKLAKLKKDRISKKSDVEVRIVDRNRGSVEKTGKKEVEVANRVPVVDEARKTDQAKKDRDLTTNLPEENTRKATTKTEVSQPNENEDELNQKSEKISKLIRNLLDSESLATEGGRLLLWAAKNGFDTHFEFLMKKGAKDDELDPSDGRSPLHFLAEAGSDIEVQMLLDRWKKETSRSETPLTGTSTFSEKSLAKLNLQDANKATALILAATRGHTTVVDMLLKAGVDSNAEDKNQRTALSWAAGEGHQEIVTQLLRKGSNPNVVDGDPPQSILARVSQTANVDIATLLMDHGAKLDRKGMSDNTTMFLAVSNGRRNMVQLFLSRKADPNELDDATGHTVLGRAVEVDQHEIAMLLVAHGANIEKGSGYFKQSPLSLAAQLGRIPTVKFLLESNANVEQKDTDGWTPLMFAAGSGNFEAAELLVKYGATFSFSNNAEDSALSLALGETSDDFISLLLSISSWEDAKSKPHLTKAILWASGCGNGKILRSLLDNSVDVNAQDTSGSTPLLKAAQGGYLDAVETLLKEGANPNLANDRMETPLYQACYKGSKKIVEALLASHAEVDIRTSNKSTALLAAAEEGHEEIVKVLLAASADFSAENDKKETPLYWASRKGFEKIVRMLLDKDADPNTVTDDGATPLLQAIEQGNPEIAELLLARKAKFDIPDSDGYSALNLAAWNSELRIVQVLLDMKADIKSKDNLGDTPLHQAAYRGNKDLAQLLLVHKADKEARNDDRETPLHYAAFNGAKDVARLLIEHKAEHDCKDKNLLTPLSQAAAGGHEAIVTLLIDAGAEIDSEDKDGRTPLSWAASDGNEAVVRLLLLSHAKIDSKDNDDRTPLLWAASGGQDTVAQLLIETKAALLSTTKDGSTALHLAAANGNEALVKVLLEEDNEEAALVRAFDKNGRTALHSAAEKGYGNVVELLLEDDAELNAEDCEKETPLSIAARSGNEEVVSKLLIAGANANTADLSGRTPLLLAIKSRLDSTIILKILDKGVDTEKHPLFSMTPLQEAVAKNLSNVVDHLLTHGAKPTSQDIQGRTAAHIAAERPRPLSVLQGLLERGLGGSTLLDISQRDKQGRDIIHHAACCESADALEYLLGILRGQDRNPLRPNRADNDGWTPLHWAAKSGELEVIRLLVSETEADAKARESLNNWSPLQIAQYNGHDEVVSLLLAHSDPAEVVSAGFEHKAYSCDGCYCNIRGKRFKCEICDDFDFCDKCKHSSDQTHPNHTFKEVLPTES